jgi:gliding motility-associated-like protein
MCATGIYLPNAFSPNNDNENDFLQVYYENALCITSLHIAIYDRFGEKVFESTDPAFKWEGSYRGQIVNTQVVTYYLTATLIDGKEISKQGNISLVR